MKENTGRSLPARKADPGSNVTPGQLNRRTRARPITICLVSRQSIYATFITKKIPRPVAQVPVETRTGGTQVLAPYLMTHQGSYMKQTSRQD